MCPQACYTCLCDSVAISYTQLRCIWRQILRDVPKSRREVDLHWRTSTHSHIVNLTDVYENVFMGHRSLLVVMEW